VGARDGLLLLDDGDGFDHLGIFEDRGVLVEREELVERVAEEAGPMVWPPHATTAKSAPR
jgi:hypothetical protein